MVIKIATEYVSFVVSLKDQIGNVTVLEIHKEKVAIQTRLSSKKGKHQPRLGVKIGTISW